MSPRPSVKVLILFIDFFLAPLIHFCPIHHSGFNLEMAIN